MAAYPANRYALVLGVSVWLARAATTETMGWANAADHLSLPGHRSGSLATTQQQTGARLDVLAFSASPSSQLDVLQMIQPMPPPMP